MKRAAPIDRSEMFIEVAAYLKDRHRVITVGRIGFENAYDLAVSRLLLDNVVNFQASWPTMGYKVAQTALFFGANDFGSTMLEENVVSQAGAQHQVSLEG